MKKIIFLGLVALFVAGSAGRSLADYYHDNRGWYDEHHHRHGYIYHHHHRGYWDNRNGVRVFINV